MPNNFWSFKFKIIKVFFCSTHCFISGEATQFLQLILLSVSTGGLHPFRRTGTVYLQAMTKITLRNDLEGKEVKIREGNAGSTRELCTLKPGRTFDIHKDPNATYREYIFITLPDNTKLRVLTSDDFAEFKKISIYEEDGKYDWMDTAERKSAPGGTAQGGLFKRIFRKIGLQ